MSDSSNMDDKGGEDLFGSLPVKPSYMTVRSVDWQSVLPWTLIFRTVPLAGGFSVVSLGALGVLLSWLGWSLGGFVLGINDERLETLPHLAAIEAQHASVTSPAVTLPKDRKLSELPRDGVTRVIGYYWSPAVGVLRVPEERGLVTFAYLSWGLLWSLAVWSWTGGAIARIAVVRLGRDEGMGIKSALLFSTRRFLAFFAPPLYPLALLVLLALLGILPGLLVRLDWGAGFVSVFWLLGLAVSMIFTIVILGVLVGWPLMVVTTAAEGTDSLDGLARGFAYSFQRPINYALYLIVSICFSILCVAVAALVANLVLDLTYWSMSWGAGGERIATLRPHLMDPASEILASEATSGSLKFAQGTFQFWDGLLGVLLNGFAFGLFWCLYSAIYLLLRRDVDETEVDEVFIDDEEQPLPDLTSLLGRGGGNTKASESEPAVESDESQTPTESLEFPGNPAETGSDVATTEDEGASPKAQKSGVSGETEDPVPDDPSGTAEDQGGESEDLSESGNSDETMESLDPPPKDQDER